MKKLLSAVKWVVVAVVCAGVISNLQADSAKVIRIKGAARYSTGNNIWLTLHEGDALKPGTVIQTASESGVDLLIGEASDTAAPSPIVRRFNPGVTPDDAQNIIRLRENTVLALDKLSSEQTGADVVTDTQLDLRSGRILGNVKKLSAASRYEIKLPNGVAGIRGTLFDLSATGILKVFFGSVTISYYDAQNQLITKTVNAGYVLDFSTGKLTPLPTGENADPLRAGESTTPVTYITKDKTETCISPVVGDNRR